MKTTKKDDIMQEDKQSFFYEMSVLKTLDHPNIIKMYELYEDEKKYYLITE